jgi:hypothetical protein
VRADRDLDPRQLVRRHVDRHRNAADRPVSVSLSVVVSRQMREDQLLRCLSFAPVLRPIILNLGYHLIGPLELGKRRLAW